MMMMLDPKDPAIRLFGRTIQLVQYDAVSGQSRSPPDAPVLDCQPSSSESDHHLCSSNSSVSPQTLSNKSCTDGGRSVDLKQEHGSSSLVLENTSGGDETNSSPEEEEEEEEEEEGGTSGSQAKPLKKPTKILPCPRCNSSDTKFCYFNNYNVNQPRHLCKKCQRYWTAGGTMRSMVIGAGRRKSKSSCSSQQSYVIPFRAQPDAPLTLREDSNENGANQDAQNPASDSASISFQSFATLWPNPWSPAHRSSSVPPPAGFVPIYAVPPYWSCGALAWMPPASASADQRPYSALGKHPRDDKTTESKVLVPKTLRFDDPRDAAQSSIWTTLGIKNDKAGISLDSGAFFSGFQPKDGETTSARLTSDRLLQANPAALARSFAFHECA